MLRCRNLLRTPLFRSVSTYEVAPVRGNSDSSVMLKDAAENIAGKAAIFEYIDTLSIRDICQPNSIHAAQLVRLLTNINQGNDMRKIRNKLVRKFKTKYSAVFYSIRNHAQETELLDMKMFRRIGPRQYAAFNKALTTIIEHKTYTYEQKKSKLYAVISLQHDMFPEVSRRKGIVIAEYVHQWFWDNIPRQDAFNHYYFLVKNDVHLASSYSVRRMQRRLMQGSELDQQLVSFQIFLHNDAHRELFYSKFSKLYSFDSMLLVLNSLVHVKDFRHVKLYLSALLFKMDTQEAQDLYPTTRDKQLLFVKFNNSLLYFLSQSENIDMFLETFKAELEFMKKMGLLGKGDDSNILKLLHKPLLFIVTLLRKKEMHEKIFELLSIVQKLPIQKSHYFNQFILNELIVSFRSFSDPKITCQYAISGFKKSETAEVLNDLGIWCLVFHDHQQPLSKDALHTQLNSMEILLPKPMRVSNVPSCAVFTEIYRAVLSTNARTMNKDQYQDLILNLYAKYTAYLKRTHSKFKGSTHDTGVLMIFLHHIRYELKNFSLAFDILRDFYTQKFNIGIRNTASKCPFSLVIYKNHDLNQSQVDFLLGLMHKHKIPLNFHLCTAMVLRYLKLNNQCEAYSWYKKILHAGFTLKHTLLIKAVAENNWDFPPNFDTSSLEKIKNDILDPDEGLFIEEPEENIQSDEFLGSIDQEESLQKLIDLVKNI